MAATITIPLTRLSPGTVRFPVAGGQAVADTDTLIVLTVDRTVSQGATQGFNGQPATTTAEITAEQSNDGGATWFLAVGGTVGGGQFFNPPPPKGDGSLITASLVQVPLYAGTGRQVRATVTVTGAQVAVAGSLTVT